jgi:hypothetical protein
MAIHTIAGGVQQILTARKYSQTTINFVSTPDTLCM